MDNGSGASGGGPTLAGVSILIVEDDPAGGRLLQVLLTQEGAEVRLATTAEDALAVLQRFPARVLIVDIVLPAMSGLGLVRLLKADAATSGIVAIAVSVVDGPQTERASLDSGCAAYVRKPIDVQTFARTIQKHVTRGMP